MAEYNQTKNNGTLHLLGKDNHVNDFVDPFSYLYLKIIFTVLYCAVTVTCIVGNILVLFVLINFRQMHSITNFFLANLAIADLCVGLFCVMQTLITPYLLPYWPFGEVMCRLQYFVQLTSYTASILILTVISVERYLVIIHPLTSRVIIRRRWLVRLTGFIVWLMAAAYGSPMIFNSYVYSITSSTTSISVKGNYTEVENVTTQYCIDQDLLDTKAFVLVNFLLMYVLPFGLMLFIYSKVCKMLTESGKLRLDSVKMDRRKRRRSLTKGLKKTESKTPQTICEDTDSHENTIILDSENLTKAHTQVREKVHGEMNAHCSSDATICKKGRSASHCDVGSNREHIAHNLRRSHQEDSFGSSGKKKTLASRKKVIRLLIVLILTFAFCVLPHHIRQLVHNWGPSTRPTVVDTVMVPVTYLLLYLNSCLNPILYALLSEKFRSAYRQIACRKCKIK